MQKKSILKIVSGFDDGGVYTCEYNFISRLREKGFFVDLVIVGQGDRFHDYKGISDNFILLENLNSTLSGGLSKTLKEILKIRKYGNTNYKKVTKSLDKPYYAIIYRRPMYMFLAAKLSKTYRCRAYWHMPNIVGGTVSRLFYSIFLTRNRIIPIANSEFTKRTLPNICKHVVYPGYSTERVIISTKNFRRELNIDSNHAVYGMAGRICHDKAQDLLVAAFIQSKPFQEGAHLVLAGGFESDDFRVSLECMAGSHLNRQIHLIGRIEQLPKFYSTIDVAINARRNVEPFGISIAEALGAGKPVIAYYLGGPSEMIVNNVNGWLITEANINGYKEVLDLSFDKRANWKRMGSNSMALNKFTVDYNVDKLIAILKQNNDKQ